MSAENKDSVIQTVNLASENIYINLTTHNNYLIDQTTTPTTVNKTPIKCEYRENRTQPLLLHSDEWKMSVIEMVLPSSSIPLFRWFDNHFSITLRYDNGGLGTFESRQYLQYVPIVNPAPVNGQRFIFQVQQMITSIGAAFKAAFDVIVLAYDAANVAQVPPLDTWATNPNTPTFQPLVHFDHSTQLISIQWGPTYLSNNADRLDIYWNVALDRKLINIMSVEQTAAIAADNGKEILLYTDEDGNIGNIIEIWVNNSGTVAQFPIYSSTQEFSVIASSWPEVWKIVLIGEQFKVRKQYLNDIQDSGVNAQNNSTSSIPAISTYTYQYGDGGIDHSDLIYNGGAAAIWYDLLNKGPLVNIHLKAQYITHSGEIFDILLEPGQNFSIKLLFRKIN